MGASDKSGNATSALDWSLIRARISAELGRDRKKAAILGLLILVGAIFGFRVLVKGSPASASAAAVVSAPSGVSGGGDRQGALGPQGDAANREVRRVTYIKQLNYDFDRDLFAVNVDYFPPPPKTLAAGPRVVLSADPNAEEIQRLMQNEAKALALQSTVVGTTPIAIINGPDSEGKTRPQVLRVGETINGFKVTQISCQSCTIKKNDVTILLEMKRDKSDK